MNDLEYLVAGQVVYLIGVDGDFDSVKALIPPEYISEWTMKNVDRVVYGEGYQESIRLAEISDVVVKNLGFEPSDTEDDPWAWHGADKLLNFLIFQRCACTERRFDKESFAPTNSVATSDWGFRSTRQNLASFGQCKGDRL